MMTKIFDLSFEIDSDAIELEQDAGCGEVNRIILHPIHLRMLAEKTGLMAPSSDIEADRTIARLCRQMRILFDRIDRLDDELRIAAGKGHEDLDAEMNFSFATWELAKEFISDLPLAEVTQPALQNHSMSASPGDKGKNAAPQAASTQLQLDPGANS